MCDRLLTFRWVTLHRRGWRRDNNHARTASATAWSSSWRRCVAWIWRP